MISIKKYLDIVYSDVSTIEPEEANPLDAALDCCRGVLSAVGKSAVQISPALGGSLQESLRTCDRSLSIEQSTQSIKRAKSQIEEQLQEWGARTAEDYKAKADEVKELLIALAKTAESVGNKDEGYASRFKTVMGRIETIADLNDLTQIRSSIVRSVTEMKNSVEQMTRDSQELVSQLRAEINTYETKLKTVEHLALKDELTGLANRHTLEERINWSIDNKREFCVSMLDLNHFKFVNDTYGHLAGDELLKQFASELRVKTRSCDLVGRWGGDEFLVVLSCNKEAANAHMARIREWVFGNYTICSQDGSSIIVAVNASVGLAQWQPGATAEQLIAESDAEMYADKKRSRK